MGVAYQWDTEVFTARIMALGLRGFESGPLHVLLLCLLCIGHSSHVLLINPRSHTHFLTASCPALGLATGRTTAAVLPGCSAQNE